MIISLKYGEKVEEIGLIKGEFTCLRPKNKKMRLLTKKLKNPGLIETDSSYRLTKKVEVLPNFLFGFKCADHN